MKIKKALSFSMTIMICISLTVSFCVFSQADEVNSSNDNTILTLTNSEIETTYLNNEVEETTTIDYSDKGIYNLVYDTQGYEASADFTTSYVIAGTEVILSSAWIYKDGYRNYGWTDGENFYNNGDIFVMPEHHVTLTPLYYKYYNITYSAGDYEGITGAKEVTFERYETETMDLPSASRFGRSGYKIIGWQDIDTGEIYNPISQYTMPSKDVTMMAVWEPVVYNIAFSSNNSTGDKFTVEGTYGEEIILPLNIFKYDGYKFVGWQYGGTVYKPGDSFLVPAALPGLSISLKAVWEPLTGDEEPDLNAISLVKLKRNIGNGTTAEQIKNLKLFLFGIEE